MKMKIVEIQNGEPTTSTIAIAHGCDVNHASVIKIVRSYKADLEEFGLLDFKSESTGGRPTEYALLNERQSTLIMTYMRNSPVVREFKKTLVREFWNLVRLNERTTSVMQEFAEALKRMEEDKDLASIHGKALAHWKGVRKQHIEAVTEAHSKAQLLLNFK